MKMTFLGAAHEVTGSCTLIEACGKNILVDCGMEQGADIYENCELPVNPADIDCVLLTHAHIDHSGKLPALTARGYTGPIYATLATKRLCDVMLLDAAHIQETEAQWKNRKAARAGEKQYEPPYTVEDAQKALTQFIPCDYKKQYKIFDFCTVSFTDAGHLLGSSSIKITLTENVVTKTLLFSGDLGNVDRPLIRDPQKPENADVVVIESTYGNRLHGARGDYTAQLANAINETLGKGGNLVIPAFAVGRTQEMLYLIREIKEMGLAPACPGFKVWVDSPLAVQATKIYSGGMTDYYDETTLDYLAKGINVLDFEGLNMSVTTEQSRMLNTDAEPKVIISASGMCEAGRIRHHLKHNLWRSECAVMFVGYQAVGTLGRILCDGAKKVKIFGEEIAVNSKILTMDGISGHADMDMLLGWLKSMTVKPERVYVNHGDDTVCDEFAATVNEKLGVHAEAPYNGAQYDIVTGECLDKGNTVRLEKKTPAKVSAAFAKLLDAMRRLSELINRCSGRSNTDLNKFTDDINILKNKWE